MCADFIVDGIMVSYLIHYNYLLQSLAYIITKWDNYLFKNVTEVYYKIRQGFLLKIATILLQNAKISTSCELVKVVSTN